MLEERGPEPSNLFFAEGFKSGFAPANPFHLVLEALENQPAIMFRIVRSNLPRTCREISNWDERGYRSLGIFQVERTPSLDSVPAHLPAPSSRPSLVSTSWVIASAWDFPFLQKAMRGIASPVATTRLARKIVRRHSTGESLSSVSSVTASGALNARLLMKEGIAR